MTPDERAIRRELRLQRRRERYAARKEAGTLPQRNYSREENRRNQIAQEHGFPTRAQLRSARRSGNAPTAKAEKVAKADEVVNPWTGTVLTPGEIKKMRAENLRWSDTHSRSVNSKWHPRWGDDKAVMYYMLYVYGWNPEHEPYPVIGFRAPDEDQDQALVYAYFTSIGMTAAAIHKFNYVRGD